MLTNEEKAKLSKKVQNHIAVLERNLEHAEETIRSIQSKDITRVVFDPYHYKIYLPEAYPVRFRLGESDYPDSLMPYIDFKLDRKQGTLDRGQGRNIFKVYSSEGILFHPESWNTGHLLLDE